MDMTRFKNVLEILKGIGAKECGIEEKDGMTLVRSISDDAMIGIYTTIEHMGNPAGAGIGILSIQGMLSRIDLFDLEKATVTFTEEDASDDSFVSSIHVKQGRRKSDIRTTSPSSCRITKQIPEFEKKFSITFSSDEISMLNKAYQSLRNVTSDKDCEVQLTINEDATLNLVMERGQRDRFAETFQGEHLVETKGEVVFAAEPLLRAIKQAGAWSEDQSATVVIDAEGNATVKIGEISTLVVTDYSELA